MSVKDFENARWGSKDQKLSFRHKVVTNMVKGGRVLDLGCGDGLMLDLLRNKSGVDGRGLDVSEEAVRKCRAKGIPAEVFDFESNSLPFEDNEFDYVLMLDILEHLYVPSRLLTEAARVTRNAVIIGVPNFNSLSARLQVLRGRVPENNTPGKGHIYWFNKDILSGMLNGANLMVANISVNTYWQNKKLLAAPTRMLMRWFPQLFALSFIVKAKKKS